MKGETYLLALTTTEDEVTEKRIPLFAFPVDVCSAVDGAREPKYEIVAPSGAERTQAYLDTGRRADMVKALLSADTEKEISEALDLWVVPDALCPRGVFVGDEFKEISKEDRDEVTKRLSSRTMVVQGRMPRTDFLLTYGLYAKSLHYLQNPKTGGSAVAYRLTFEALREVRKGKRVVQEASVVVAKRVARSRESNVAIFADEARGCLMMVTFAFVPSMKEPDDAVTNAVATANVDDRQIEVARRVVAALPDAEEWLATADDAMFPEREKLIAQAVQGKGITPPTTVAAADSSRSLLDALEASLAAVREDEKVGAS
jgi:hypothetical protein